MLLFQGPVQVSERRVDRIAQPCTPKSHYFQIFRIFLLPPPRQDCVFPSSRFHFATNTGISFSSSEELQLHS